MVKGHCSLHFFREEQCKPDRVNSLVNDRYIITRILQLLHWRLRSLGQDKCIYPSKRKNLCEVWARIDWFYIINFQWSLFVFIVSDSHCIVTRRSTSHLSPVPLLKMIWIYTYMHLGGDKHLDCGAFSCDVSILSVGLYKYVVGV